MGESHALAATFWVPRLGRIERVDVRSFDELRLVRTELELLRRIVAWLRSGTLIARRLPTRAFSNEDRYELRLIRLDAGHPIVEESISTIDRRHRSIRKETMMSLIDEEAKNIAQEIAENDAVPSDDANPQQSPVSDMDAVTDALASAESELARVTAEAAPISTPQSAEAPPATTEPVDQPAATTPSDNAEAVPMIEIPPTDGVDASTDSADQSIEPTPPLDVPAAQPVPTPDGDAAPDPLVDETPLPEPIDVDQPEMLATPAGVAEASLDPADAEALATTSGPPVVDVVVASPADSSEFETAPLQAATLPTDLDQTLAEIENNLTDPSPTAETAAPSTVEPIAAVPTPDPSRAVGEIERGIRKLADMLSKEVNDQWIQAKEALKDVLSARAEIEKSSEQTRQMLSDIERIKGEAQVARAETELVRQEARLLREDAERSKQRAEHSAKVAELAADQANEEARSILREQLPTG